MSILWQLLGCCYRNKEGKDLDSVGPTETTPLLPEQDHRGPPVLPPFDLERSQRLQDKITAIQRETEAKLLNSGQKHPFNLRSSARNPSRSHSHSHSHSGGSSSRSSTPSQSTSSRAPADVSPVPIARHLNARIVRPPGRGTGSTGSVARGRLGRYGEERGTEFVQAEHGQHGRLEAVDEPEPVAAEPLSESSEQRVNHVSIITRLSRQIGQELSVAFQFRDVGPLVLQYDD